MADQREFEMIATKTIQVDVTASVPGKGFSDELGFDVEPTIWADFTINIAGVSVPIKSLPENLRAALWESVTDELYEDDWEDQE